MTHTQYDPSKPSRDPDEMARTIDAATFGKLLARQIQENPSSQNWALIGYAIAAECNGLIPEFEEIEAVVKRLAEGKG